MKAASTAFEKSAGAMSALLNHGLTDSVPAGQKRHRIPYSDFGLCPVCRRPVYATKAGSWRHEKPSG